MKNVLIALDYYPTAQKVAEVGFSLAKTLNADVTLLHVITNPAYYSSKEYSPIVGFAGYMDTAQVEINSANGLRNASQHFLDKMKLHLGSNDIKTEVVEGEFAPSILKAAKDLKTDIIVMGSHSHKWFENIVMGSITEKVLHLTTIPLFIIPTKKNS